MTIEDQLLLGSSIKELLNRNFTFIRQFGEAPNVYAVLMRHEGGISLALAAWDGEPEGPADDPYFLIHRFLIVNSFDLDRPVTIAWKRPASVKYLVFDPWRAMQRDEARDFKIMDGVVTRPLSLKFGHEWILNQDFSTRWTQIKGMRKVSVPLDRFL